MPVRPKWLSILIDQEVTKRIADDSRTVAGTFLGWPKATIFQDVIDGGQADFDAPIGHLTGNDRALLYAKFNQSRHLDELGAAFGKLFEGITVTGRITVLDLGCGPFTAGLALAMARGNHGAFRYYGIDKYQSMRCLGEQLAASAQQLSAFHPHTTYWFGDSLANAEFGPIRGELTVVIASYLLASPTLDVQDLVAQIGEAGARIGPGPKAVLYTNSATQRANQKYPAFREGLLSAGFQVIVDDVELFTETSKDHKPLRYALLFKAEETEIRLGAPKS